MLITTIKMTPEMAAGLLAKNTNNRPIRKYRVNEFIDIIKSGEWKTTHQGVALDQNGVLIDGQHRLEAIRKAGQTVEILVVEGLPPSARLAIDTHAKRSYSDILGTRKDLLNPCVFLTRIWTSKNVPSPVVVSSVAEVFMPFSERLHAAVNIAGQRVLSSTPLRAAAVLHMALGREEYVLNLYRNMIEVNQEALPVVARSFMKQMMMTFGPYALGNKQRVDAVRAWIVFNPDNADNQRVMVKDYTVRFGEMRGEIENLMRAANMKKAA